MSMEQWIGLAYGAGFGTVLSDVIVAETRADLIRHGVVVAVMAAVAIAWIIAP